MRERENLVFVGNKITMEGVYVELSDDIKSSKKYIDDALYNVFESPFCDKEHKNFLKTMKINNVLFGFMEYHVGNFIERYRLDIKDLLNKDNSNEITILAESYFKKSLCEYKNRLKEVAF